MQSPNTLISTGQVSVHEAKSTHEALQDQSPSGEELRPLANFSKSSRKTPTVPLTVYALLEMHKKPSISNIRKISCRVYKNICNKLRTKPEALQVGLTGQRGEESSFMGYFL